MSFDLGDKLSFELEADSQARSKLRWLHAGLYKNAQGSTKDIWFAFKKKKHGKHQIIYASDWSGTSLGNYNVGRRKSDQITWDSHHSKKWEKHITSVGTWEYGNAMRGRRLQRETLLETWLDPNSPDLFGHGRDHNRALGPPLNVIHTTNNYSPPIPRNNRAARPVPHIHSPAECYPGTSITFSTAKIRVEAYKGVDEDPLGVVANFMTGNLAGNPRFTARRKDQNDAIEAAFYARGWRLNRSALEKANDDIAAGDIANVVQSKAWRNHPPLWVDRFRGNDLNELLQQMKDDLGEEVNADDDSSESTESDESPPISDSNSASDSGSDSNDEGRGLLYKEASSAGPSNKSAQSATSKPSKVSKESSSNLSKNLERRLWRSLTSGLDSSDDEEYDFLSDTSPLKGKAPAKKRKENPNEDLHLGADAHNFELIIDEASSTPAKRFKSESMEMNFLIALDDDVDAESDSDIVKLTDKLSTPPKIIPEYIDLDADDDLH